LQADNHILSRVALPSFSCISSYAYLMNDRHIFQHAFSHGITGTVLFVSAKHYDHAKKSIRPEKLWNRPPTDAEFESIFSEYREWMHTFNAELSAIIQGDHTYVVQDRYAKSPFWEFWVYHANGERECVTRKNGIFDPAFLGR
jgi:hypothetical protein